VVWYGFFPGNDSTSIESCYYVTGGPSPPLATHHTSPPMLFTNFTATGRNLYTLFRDGRNEQAWTRLEDIPADLVPLAAESSRIAVTAGQYDALVAELVK